MRSVIIFNTKKSCHCLEVPISRILSLSVLALKVYKETYGGDPKNM